MKIIKEIILLTLISGYADSAKPEPTIDSTDSVEKKKPSKEVANSVIEKNSENKYYTEAFINFVRKGELDSVKALLATIPEKQISDFVMAKVEYGSTALHAAASSGNAEMVKLLLKSLPSNKQADFVMTKNQGGKTALLTALSSLYSALSGPFSSTLEKKEEFIANAPSRYLQVDRKSVV